MTSAQKIRDSLFSISWSIRPTANNYQYTVEVINPDIFRFCRLSFVNNGLQGVVLDIEIQFSKTVEPVNMEKILVQASKNGVEKTMTLSQPKSKWTSLWIEQPCHYCHSHNQCSECANITPVVGFEILIDLTPGSLKEESKYAVLQHLNLWNTKTLSDVTFNCKRKSIEAHTWILAPGSPVFAAMFQNDFKEKQDKVVEITDIEANIFENLLKYIYTGETTLETEVEDVAELLVAADKYAVETLKEKCALYLLQDLKVENATRYLILAHLHNLSVLYESTLEFMSKNAKAVCSRKDWMDIIKNYPELCFQATQLMVGL
jgi:hypothetical protein